jgi:hypothetical protein
MMSTKLYWNDTRHTGFIGQTSIQILAAANTNEPQVTDDPMNAHCILYTVGDSDQIHLLRFSAGAVVDLPTNDVVHAKNAVFAMLRMEANDG